MMNPISRIERLLHRTDLSASRIGRDAMGDPGFVHSLRCGRQMRPATEARLAAWLDAAERRVESGPCAR